MEKSLLPFFIVGAERELFRKEREVIRAERELFREEREVIEAERELCISEHKWEPIRVHSVTFIEK